MYLTVTIHGANKSVGFFFPFAPWCKDNQDLISQDKKLLSKID